MCNYKKILQLKEDNKLHTSFCSIINSCKNINTSSQIVTFAWKNFKENFENENSSQGSINSKNGIFFELLIQYLLVRNNILPFYKEAKVTLVPNVSFDVIIYTKERIPICLSLKTSLRERYKQADLEAMALRQVHRRARTFLLTLSTSEAKGVNDKIEKGDVVGLERVIDCNTEELDSLFTELKKYTPIESEKIELISGGLVR